VLAAEQSVGLQGLQGSVRVQWREQARWQGMKLCSEGWVEINPPTMRALRLLTHLLGDHTILSHPKAGSLKAKGEMSGVAETVIPGRQVTLEEVAVGMAEEEEAFSNGFGICSSEIEKFLIPIFLDLFRYDEQSFHHTSTRLCGLRAVDKEDDKARR
jgi:hypothetical protein